MQRLVFSRHKQKILEFVAEDLQFTQEPNGLMLAGSGEIIAQDTAAVEEAINLTTPLHVSLYKGEEQILDAPFQVTFFTLEPGQLAFLLQ